MFQIKHTKINGCFILESRFHEDQRGLFGKNFNSQMFQDLGLDLNIKEQFYSVSKKNTIRGMHYQTEPFSQNKLISCIRGEAIDVFLDIRKNSETFGNYDSIYLSEKKNLSIYLSSGIAHGFLSLKDETIILYNTSEVYSSQHDQGIKWNSFGYDWGINNPIISNRDKLFNNFEKQF